VFFSRLLGRFKGAVAAGLGIAAYTLLVGAEPAVVRAAIMGGLSLFARQVGRRQEGLNSLAGVAAAMALFNPQILADASYQLSFGATLGLVLYADPLAAWFERLITNPLSPNPLLPSRLSLVASRLVSEYFLFTLAAQVTTLPVMALHFRRISLVSLVANPAILPAQPAVMVLGGLAVLLGMVYLPLGQVAGALAWPFVAYTIRAVELFGALQGGVLALGAVGVLGVAGYYAVLFAWTFAGARARQAVTAIGPGLSLAAAGLLTVLVWRAALAAPDGRLHLVVLDASDGSISGDALLVQSPTGRYLLINGGPSSRKLSDALGRRLPFAHRRLDYLVVAHPRQEEIRALPTVTERFPPGAVLWAGNREASTSATALLDSLSQAQVPVTEAVPGQFLDLGGGARLQVLACGKSGGVFLLEWGNFRAVLPIGANFAELEALQNGRAIGSVSVLLLADHGYAPINPPEWIANLRPQVALLSVAARDGEGLPSPETLAALEGYTLLRTDQNGWIHLSTDGERMWVEVERSFRAAR
jgi:competence protein ComEC